MPRQVYLFLVALVLVFIIWYQNTLNNNATARPRSIRQIFIQAFNVNTETDIYNAPDNSKEEQSYSGNLPEMYFYDYIRKPTRFNKTCGHFPRVFDLNFRNDYWQLQKTSNGTFHLFNAYLDDRNGSFVRIVGMYDQYLPSSTFYCWFWYNTNKPLMTESLQLFWLWGPNWGADRHNNLDLPYLISCPLPNATQIPMSVSLVGNLCDKPTNNLRIKYKEVAEKKNFVVCVKGLHFPYEDRSVRLAEWIELLNILGAEKINFYEYNVHNTTKKMLNYYVDQGKIEVTPLSLVGDVSNHPYLQHRYLHVRNTERRLQEVIPYNDCLYKHLQEFKYVVLLDTDEVIVPVEGNWVQLISAMQQIFHNRTSYTARNVYFLDSHQLQHDWFDGIPKYMHMLQHVYRAKEYTKPGYFVKGFHDTQKVLGLHNHYPFACYGGCSMNEINLTLAHLQHYRSGCIKGVGDCLEMKINSVMDTRVWNYKDELIERVQEALKNFRVSYR